jgi:two-component system cell cycle sensor histidine kinase/response regulator CckA
MDRLLKLLLIEDSEEDAELITLELRRGGYLVEATRVSTRQGMEKALELHGWDVALADYSMPSFTMSEALAMVRERGLDVPFIIVSASIIEEAAIQAMREGAHDFIMKDKLGRLVPAVTRELREAVVRRERRHLEEHVRQSQKMESLGVLAGGVAHDFNNLLVGIMGNASLAIDMLPESSPVVPLLDDVVLASQKAADLTRQMLAYAGKGRFVCESTDLSSLVRDIGGLVRTSISKKVDLYLNLESNLPPIEADPTQVQQLIMNLLINGAEAIGERSGAVTVTTGLRETRPGPATGHFAVDGTEAGPYVVLEVSDTGCGMDEATVSRIFEPFFSTKFTGRGLGLAAALGIVRAHRGALKVDTQPGRGSRFEVLFPALTDRSYRKPSSSREVVFRRAAASAGHILVVDDEEVVRRTAKAALEQNGYTVLLSENGQQAVDIFRGLSDQIALVLLDLTMPVMSGEEAFRQLRAIRRDVVIILTSGYDETQALEGFGGSDVSGFMQKPYTGDELAQAVRAVMGGRAACV